MGKTKTYEASLYGHGSCNRVMMITGETDIHGIKNWYEIHSPETTLQSITRTSDGYRVDHNGRSIIKKYGPAPEMEMVYMDLISNIREVENLLQEVA
jgi:predicted MarR family transcription regulator